MKSLCSLRAASLFLAFLLGGIALSSCASVTPYEESVLLEAGFHPVLSETVSERNAYAALPAYKVQRTDAPGKPIYAYRNESKDVTYVGGEAEYRRYQDLIQKKGAERNEILTNQMNQDGLHIR